jgi:hypothetical protein
MSARFVCKACGAESPTGIGYASHGEGPLPAPAFNCGNPHLPPVVGSWDSVTRGFWQGGRYATVDELAPGAVFRWGTYSGYVMADERPAFPYVSTARDIVCESGTIIRLARASVLEVTS